MKVQNVNSVRLGGVTHPPSAQTEAGYHDLPKGPALDGLLAMGAVTPLGKPEPPPKEGEGKPEGEAGKGGGAKP